jgi:hypothetical protein
MTSKSIVARNTRTPKPATRSQPTTRRRAPSLGGDWQRAARYEIPPQSDQARRLAHLSFCPLCGAGGSETTRPVACLPNARVAGTTAAGVAVRCSLAGVHLHQSCSWCSFAWVVEAVPAPRKAAG